jgi:Mg2+ and Co2+ transporter CorA
MQRITQSIQALPQENPEYEYITTTLYDLIEAINEELKPGEEELLGMIVSDLAEDQRILPLRESLNKTRKSNQNG